MNGSRSFASFAADTLVMEILRPLRLPPRVCAKTWLLNRSFDPVLERIKAEGTTEEVSECPCDTAQDSAARSALRP